MNVQRLLGILGCFGLLAAPVVLYADCGMCEKDKAAAEAKGEAHGSWMQELNLTDEQKTRIQAIKDEKRQRVEAIHKESHEKINAVLNKDQQAKFKEMKAKHAKCPYCAAKGEMCERCKMHKHEGKKGKKQR